MKSTITTYFNDFVHLIYPEACLSCSRELASKERHLCSLCDSNLIETSHHLYEEPSEFDQLFWGRSVVSHTFAMYFFHKKSVVQTVLFQLKYKHSATIGSVFGKRIGNRLLASKKYHQIEVLLPVPLHPRKEFVRGYNQSLALALGISESSKIPVNYSLLKRNTNNSSQTRKGRFQRWDNVNSVFSVDPTIAKYTHIGIVDDVITTGSTVEALIISIRQQAPNIKVSVITLAIT